MSVSRRKTDQQRKLEEMESLLSDGPTGPQLRKWCDQMLAQRRHLGIVALTQIVVRSADGLYALGEMVRQGMTGYAMSMPGIDEWELMYRRSRSMIQQTIDQFCCVPPDWRELLGIPEEVGPVGAGTALRSSQLVIRELQRQDPEVVNGEVKELLTGPEAAEMIRKGQQVAYKTYDELLTSPIAAITDDAAVEAGLELPCVQFFMLVWLPCWLEYGESASRLLERAETGEFAALEQLLRLDKRALFFPRIRKIVEESARNRVEGAFALTADAFRGVSQPQWNRDRLKIGLSTFILSQSRKIAAIEPRLLGTPLTKRDIFDAFHAFARDRGFKRDQTLPVDEEAFNKRITREKRFRSAAPWDIFSA